MSASSCCVTCGTLTQLAWSRGPAIFWMRDSGSVSTRPYFAKSTVGTAGSALAGCGAAVHDFLDERFDVVGRHAPLGAGAAHAAEVDAELARELAHGRARMRFAERGRRGDTALRAGAAARGGAGFALAAGCGAADCGASGARSRRAGRSCRGCTARLQQRPTRSPADTLEPTATFSSSTRPACGAGTSMLAFSVSSVTSPCSAATSSPGFTRMSMISTPAKSPRSGTVTSRGSAAAAAAAAAERGSFGCRTVRSSSGRGSTAAGGRRGSRAADVQRRDDTAGRHAVAGLDLQRRDLPRGRRRNVHRGLVGLERDEALLRGDAVAGLDEHLDDLDVRKVTKIGYDDFHGD